MARWQPDSRSRLEQAALALYGERGFEETTVAAIAERAGLTERTFFRYFSDKREVLFGGSGQLQELLVTAVVDAPASATPIDAVTVGLDALGVLFVGRRDFARQRQAIIVASAELRERELIKLATLAAAVADALRRREVGDPVAGLTGEVAVAVFKIAFEHWVADDNTQDLSHLMREALAELRSVTSGGSPSVRPSRG
ncbi:MAG TPA: TetR family transcriptional regulator [Acidimicrobiales bacterium]